MQGLDPNQGWYDAPATPGISVRLPPAAPQGGVPPMAPQPAGPPPMEEIHKQLMAMPEAKMEKVISSWPAEQQEAYIRFADALAPPQADPVPMADEPAKDPNPAHGSPEWIEAQTDPEVLEKFAKEQNDQPTSFLGQLGRQGALAGRYAVEGATALPGLIADHTTKPMIEALLGQKLPTTGQSLSGKMTELGVPNPQDGTERVVGDISRALAGTAAMGAGGAAMKAAPGFLNTDASLVEKVQALAPKVGNAMAEAPKAQALADVVGAGAGGITRENGGDERDQLVASIFGSMSPSVGSQMVRRAMVSSPKTMADTVESFAKAGTTPTVGQATGGHIAGKVEQVLDAFTGTGGIMSRNAQRQEREVGQRTRDMADDLRPNSNPTKAGNTVVNDLEDNFHPWAREQSDRLHLIYEKNAPNGSMIPVKHFDETIKDIMRPPKGGRNLADSSLLSDPQLGDLFQRYLKDTKDGTLSLDTVKFIRTGLGRAMSKGSGIGEDRDAGAIKRLYGALAQDEQAFAKHLDAGLVSQDKPAKVYKAYDKARKFTSDYHETASMINRAIEREGGGEKVFAALTSGTNDGATLAHTVMSNLRPPAQKLFASAFIQKIFRAPGSQENAEQTATSLTTAFTRWSNLSTTMKRTMTERFGPEFQKNFEAITKTAEKMRDSGIDKSDKGRTGLTMLMGGVTGIGPAAYFGGPEYAAVGGAALAAAFFGPRRLAYTMTNPETVDFLARSSRVSAYALPAMINQFIQQHRTNEDPEMQDLIRDLQKAQK